MTLERGTLLHKRYRIVEILGQGGMGSVYRAVDENLGMEVAVKDNLFTTEEYARQFRLEAVILASLRHPNLPRVTDHFVIGEQGQYLVMDYIEGEDLRQRMERQGSIPDEEAILIGVAMCDALHYLHTRKPSIVHRDVKPGNVKIAPDGHIYLVDFGLAKVVRGSQATTTGARAMTPGYSPPEQYGTARTDPRSDVYSLGATLYAALSGVIPEDGLARAMDNVELTPLRKRNPKIARKLAVAIEKAMAVRPDDRFQSADEFRQALLAANQKSQQKEGEIVITPPPPSADAKVPAEEFAEKATQAKAVAASEPRARRKRKGGGRIIFPLLLLALLAGAAFFWKPIYQAVLGQIDSPVTETAEPTTLASTTDLPVSTRTADPTVRPSNTSQASPTVTSPPPGTTAVLLPPTIPPATATPSFTPSNASAASETGVPVETPLAGATLTPTATSPGDGHGQIAFASSRAGKPQIYLMNADGSNPIQITNLPDGACQPDWSPDGMRIVFISPCPDRREIYSKAGLYLMNADGSEITSLHASGYGDFDPAWSPDGTRIAFTSLRDGKLQIYILNLGDNSVTHVVMDTAIQEARQPTWSPTGTQIVYTVKRVGTYQVWVMSDAGAGQAQLTRSGDYFDIMPTWSADGTTIIFTQTNGTLTIGWLMSVEYELRETQAARRMTNGTYAIDAEYFTDGQLLLFEALTGTNYDIALMSIDGLGRVRLTSDPAPDFDPTWRPVGP